MRIISLFVCSIMAFLLTGCAAPSVPLKSQSTLPNLGYSQTALNSYNQAKQADYTLDIRTNKLDPNAPVIQGIKEACSKGVQVSVLLYVGGRSTASALAGTCAMVYLTDHPDIQLSRIIMLLDGNFLVFNGSLVGIRNKTTQQEYLFQRQQKMLSQRIQ